MPGNKVFGSWITLNFEEPLSFGYKFGNWQIKGTIRHS